MNNRPSFIELRQMRIDKFNHESAKRLQPKLDLFRAEINRAGKLLNVHLHTAYVFPESDLKRISLYD